MHPNRMQRFFSRSPNVLASAAWAPAPGFTLIPTSVFPLGMQQAIASQQLIYGLAYLAALEEMQFWYGDDMLDYSI